MRQGLQRCKKSIAKKALAYGEYRQAVQWLR